MRVKKSTLAIIILASLATGAAAVTGLSVLYSRSSRNESCMSCHYHPDADASWKKSKHYNNPSGTKTDCEACHLPPGGTMRHFIAKTKTGARDIWSYVTKKPEDIDFEAKRDLEYATGIVYNESCKECHVNLLPEGISDDGITAHLYYEDNEEKLGLHCISCHLDAGHYNPNYSHAKMAGVPKGSGMADGPKFESPAELTGFKDYVEQVPGTPVTISMKAIPAGSFTMGSPESEFGRGRDEGPQREIGISRFFMGEFEVTWDQYWAFYAETMSEGRTPPQEIFARNSRPDLDAVSGPTPPFGNPDQSWGMGERPAITMSHYAATVFCQWLSLKTGRTYRLPTEAEWEYAARGGTTGAYFFEGNPKKYTSRKDTTVIGGYAVYDRSSGGRTKEPSKVKANPFGLKNMLGNVMEYCSDWYAEDAYASLTDGQQDPKGPASGTEHVVRGGLYNSPASDIRCAARASTHNDAWLRTDPQNPKSIWWYSDIKGVGFRVVCEVPEGIE